MIFFIRAISSAFIQGRIFLLFACVYLSSCSYFVRQIDQSITPSQEHEDINIHQNYCSNKNLTFQLISKDKSTQTSYFEFLKKFKNSNLNFIDKTIFWSLIQIKARPDLSSPMARFQFYLINNKNHYHDYHGLKGTSESYPFFVGLDKLLKKYPSKSNNLSWYGQMLDKYFDKSIFVSEDFANNIFKLKNLIYQDQSLKRYYFRGQDILKAGERVPSFSLETLIKKTPLVTSVNHIDKLFTYSKTPKKEVLCNYDYTLYDSSIFLIDKTVAKSNIFGLKENDQFFIASTSLKSIKPKSFKGMPLFESDSLIRSAAFCSIKNSYGQFALFANQSRDPGQHLHHLFRYGLTNISSLASLSGLITHARHLLLSDPLRIVIESERSQSAQIRELLKLNIPAYNASRLGNIWGLVSTQKEKGFVIDDRYPGAYTCH